MLNQLKPDRCHIFILTVLLLLAKLVGTAICQALPSATPMHSIPPAQPSSNAVFSHRHALVTGDDLRLLSRYVTSGGFHEGDAAWIYDDALVLPAFPTHGTDETLVTALPEAVSMNNDCLRDVPVFTTDTAPSDGFLVFRIQLGGEAHRRDTEILKWWNVTAGQQINNDIVSNVPAPRWARLWWYSDFDFTWYLLPSQYWQGDGTIASLYGVACKPAVQPPYHTSFSAAIAEDQLPHRPCTTTPTHVNPPNGAMLDTLIPLFEWDNSNEPGAIELHLEIAEDPDFVRITTGLKTHSLLSKEYRFPDNLEVSTAYYWRVFFVCNETKGPPYEVREFTTGSGGVILPAPNLISPPDASTISSETVLLQWEAVDGAVEYLVEWGKSDRRGGWYRWVSDTQCQVDYNLHPNTTYEWRVAARNDYAIGEFATRQFTTSPSNVAPVTPTNTLTPTPTDTPTPQATLNLRAGPGTQYRIVGQLRDSDALTIRGKNNEAGDWLQIVTTDGIMGWISVADIPIVPTYTPTATPTHTHTPTPSVHWIYDGSRLAEGYDMGVNTSEGRTDWVRGMDGYMCMDYPSGQSWGAVFIIVGPPGDFPRPGTDLSAYRTLSIELRGESGGEYVWVGLKDNTDPDNGKETKIPVQDLTTDWQTRTFPLSDFKTADPTRLYVVTEFVFEPGTPAETVCFRRIQYLP